MKNDNTLSDLQSLKSALMDGVEDVIQESSKPEKQVVKEDVNTEQQPAKLCAGKAAVETKEVSEDEQNKILDEEKKEKENMKKRIQRIIENRLATRRALRRRYLNEDDDEDVVDGGDEEVLDGEDELEAGEEDTLQGLCDKLDKIIAALGIDDEEGTEDLGDEGEDFEEEPVAESRRARLHDKINEARRQLKLKKMIREARRQMKLKKMIREAREARDRRSLRESRSSRRLAR